ncbi:YgiW/YdeI family stress tolerance OB fold protein [Campylobacter sp. CCUG 57310]|uniref:YgiW/YdeI family stress tolerance OB fold protein n=1 Tax=Campylobacter sp. CCUG 57310 TaxID=2517362 RepID=UPI00156335B6|nr:NirD/YgiW/YdeI family stress tolerance protein [Campylobacter sp. CCUG 57310]QKF92535.1 bacterial OB fold (BOF) protein [Campylobacter sp. CCUG 57310]
MLKKITISALLASSLLASGGFTGANANTTQNQGGFTGKGSATLMSVKEALNLRDDAPVILEGKIRSQIRAEHYEFVGKSGDVVEIEIDNHIWKGVTVDENTPIRITGKVDKDLTKTTIDVKSVEIIK